MLKIVCASERNKRRPGRGLDAKRENPPVLRRIVLSFHVFRSFHSRKTYLIKKGGL